MNESGDFERELERELQRILDPIAAESIPLRRSPNSGGIMKRLLGGAGAALGLKLATGLAVVAFAAVAAGATTEVAVTGSLSPADWGQQVKKTVADCKKLAAAAGEHGIGDCVSDFATQHGDLVSDQHPNKGNGGTTGGSTNGSSNGSTTSAAHRPTPPPGKSGTHTPQTH